MQLYRLDWKEERAEVKGGDDGTWTRVVIVEMGKEGWTLGLFRGICNGRPKEMDVRTKGKTAA